MQQAWDKNGRIYYIDDNGNRVQPKSTLNAFQKLGNDFKALKTNVKNAIDNLGIERSHTYFAPFNELKNAYESGFIGKRELPYLAQGRADQEIREANKQQKASNIKNVIGTTISGLSAHPVLNIPYVGTGLGGAVYELGQGIASGDNVDDIIDRTGQGFIVGETVGAIPYVGRGLGKTKLGQAVSEKATQGLSKLAETPLGQKVGNWASKAEDVLMSDIAQFNPNRQTVYHGSPYDFAKFSNEAIGTGEGAQAHGYGHYAAKSKDVAQEYADRLSKAKVEKNNSIFYKGKEYNFNNPVWGKNDPNYQFLAEINNLKKGAQVFNDVDDVVKKYTKLYETGLEKLNNPKEIEYLKSIGADVSPEKLSKLTNEKKQALEFIKNFDKTKLEGMDVDKQLYKLSIPKDDVMLREDLPLSQQPLKVQEALNQIGSYKTVTPATMYNGELYKHNPNGIFKGWFKANGGGKVNDELADVLDNIGYTDEIVKMGNHFDEEMTGNQIYQKLNNDYHNNYTYTQGLKPSDLLNQHGIKGISYNGGIDGEANVIFNPDDIQIVRKYYNQPQAMEYFQNLQPSLGAVVNSFEHTPVNTKEWKQYAKNNLIGKSVDVPGYTTVNFTNKNLGKDYPYNMPEYPTLLEDLANSQYAFSTNYNKETDRLYDHLVNNKKGLFDYLIEVIQDPEGNIHHNYKMMKNINRGDKP